MKYEVTITHVMKVEGEDFMDALDIAEMMVRTDENAVKNSVLIVEVDE